MDEAHQRALGMLPNCSGWIEPSAKYRSAAEIKITPKVMAIEKSSSYILSFTTCPIKIKPLACLLVFKRLNNLNILKNLRRNDSFIDGNIKKGKKAMRSIKA